MENNKVTIPPQIAFYGIMLIVALFLLYKVWDKIFGKSEDEKKIDKEKLKGEKDLGTDILGKEITGNVFEKQWFDNAVKKLGATKVNAYNKKYATVYKNTAKVFKDALGGYTTDNDEFKVVGGLSAMPSLMAINGVAYQYRLLTGKGLEQDIRNSLDDENLAEALEKINKKPTI